MAFAPRAGAYVYWTNSDSIGRAKLDGTGVDQHFIAAVEPLGIAVDRSYIYWSDSTTRKIGRANLDGTGANPDFITIPGLCLPRGVAVAGSYIYWAQDGSTNCGTIGRANLDGSGANVRFIEVPSYVSGSSGAWTVAVTGSYVYWVGDENYPLPPNGYTIGSANLDGTGVTPLTTVSAAYGVASDSTRLYWTETDGSVWRSSGQNPAWEEFITGASSPRGLAVDPTHIYWANASIGSIGRASVDGSGVNESFITGASNPVSVAVDSAELSPTVTSVDCAPGSVPIGTATSCTATVTDTSPGNPSAPSGTVDFSADSNGRIDNVGGCTLSPVSATVSTCQLTYTPDRVGAPVITATYGGDAEHAATYGQTAVSVSYRSSSLSVSCSPNPVPAGITSTCTVVVTDTDAGTASAPTGLVQGSWSDIGQGGHIGFGSCDLSPVSGGRSQCALLYTPTAVGSGQTLISATYYYGDGVHDQSSGQASVAVLRRATSVAVSCSPAMTVSGHLTLCTATVSDAESGTTTTPTGALNFSGDVSAAWPWIPPLCNLSSTGGSSAGCSLAYTPRLIGSRSRLDTVAVAYSGDAGHDGSGGAAQVTVILTATPWVQTGAASSVTMTGAVLNGILNPQGQATADRFEYGTSTSYGSRSPDGTAAGSDTADHAVSETISGLAPHTTYHYRVVATNAAGTSYGSDRQFTTQPLPTARVNVPGTVGTLGAKLTFTFACQGTVGQRCTGKAIATAIEKLSSTGTVTGVLSTMPHAGHYRVATILTGTVSATAGQSKDVSLGLNSTGQMLRNKYQNIPSEIAITTNGTTIRTTKVTFGSDPPTTSLAATPTTRAAQARIALRCKGQPGQMCRGSATITTYQKLATDHKTVTGLSSDPASKGKLATLAKFAWSVRAGRTITVTVTVNATGGNLLKKFRRLPATLTTTPTYNGYTLSILTAKITFKR
jgi:hypothetical protein